jgi:hypothetical protein
MADTPIRLRRSVFGRLFGGTPVQLPAAIALVIFPIAFASSHSHPVRFIVIIGVVAALWVLGFTAHAEADQDGLRWRTIMPRTFRWDEIERLARVANPLSMSTRRVRAVLVVRVRGRNRPIWPASMAGPNLMEFAERLGAMAVQRGIPTDV